VGLQLCYTALSPFCRKVRMAMEFKNLSFEVINSDDIKAMPAWNPRAEIPMLIDDDLIVCNSPDILSYLDRRFPQLPLYPSEARAYATVREWERIADTAVDAIATVIGNWKFADLPPMPTGLLEAAQHDMLQLYDRLQAQLLGKSYVAGTISAADFALYPQVSSGAALDLKLNPLRHSDVVRWLKAMRSTSAGQSDLAAARAWWANPSAGGVDTERVNWGTFRLEWLLANGQSEWFAEQVRQDKVLWSVGPKNNALNSPLKPASANTTK
jgi:glutathione S-transferase